MTLPLKVAILPATAVTLLIGSACATGGEAPPPDDPDLLTSSEMADHSHYSALQLIRQFRPIWLRDRTGSFNALGIEDIQNPRGIRVYFDGISQRGVEALDHLQVSEIHQIRKLDAADATYRFGIGHTAGAIVVTTARSAPGG